MPQCATARAACADSTEALCPEVTGLAAPLPVLTARGAVPVAALQPGDRLITRERGMVPLIDSLIEDRCAPMVRISAGSLGKGRPTRTLLLPAAQKLLLRGAPAWGLDGCDRTRLSAGEIADGPWGPTLGIVRTGRSLIRLCHLVLPEPLTLYAEGLELLAEEPAQRRLSPRPPDRPERRAGSRAGLRQ